MSQDIAEQVRVRNVFRFECRDRYGSLKWTEDLHNLVDTEGLDDLLTKYFKGSSYTAAWYVGLIDNTGYTTGPQATDTAAKITTTANPPTTNAWQELEAYDEAARPTLSFGSASGGSLAATAAAFTISGTVTIKGAFVASASAKHATTGVLYGAAAFSTPRSMADGDTLNVTVTATAAAA